MKNKKTISKTIFKKMYKKCAICNSKDYSTLDVHRWKVPGSQGGKYHYGNCVCLCANCHRLVHNEEIKIIGIYTSTKGKVINFINKKGEEKIQLL